MVFGSSITISTSDSLDIDNTYIETPTVTATPVNIIVKGSFKDGLITIVFIFSRVLFQTLPSIFINNGDRKSPNLLPQQSGAF